jgi:hypothetical protein
LSGGCQPFSQPIEAAFDHPTVTVITECAGSNVTALDQLAGQVQMTIAQARRPG